MTNSSLPPVYISGPYLDGKYSICETATGKILKHFCNAEDLMEKLQKQALAIGAERDRCARWAFLYDKDGYVLSKIISGEAAPK